MNDVMMILRKSSAEEMIKELKDQIVENELIIKIQDDDEFDKMISIEKNEW